MASPVPREDDLETTARPEGDGPSPRPELIFRSWCAGERRFFTAKCERGPGELLFEMSIEVLEDDPLAVHTLVERAIPRFFHEIGLDESGEEKPL